MKTETQWTDRGPWAFYLFYFFFIYFVRPTLFYGAMEMGNIKKNTATLKVIVKVILTHFHIFLYINQ